MCGCAQWEKYLCSFVEGRVSGAVFEKGVVVWILMIGALKGWDCSQ